MEQAYMGGLSKGADRAQGSGLQIARDKPNSPIGEEIEAIHKEGERLSEAVAGLIARLERAGVMGSLGPTTASGPSQPMPEPVCQMHGRLRDAVTGTMQTRFQVILALDRLQI